MRFSGTCASEIDGAAIRDTVHRRDAVVWNTVPLEASVAVVVVVAHDLARIVIRHGMLPDGEFARPPRPLKLALKAAAVEDVAESRLSVARRALTEWALAHLDRAWLSATPCSLRASPINAL